MADIEHFKGNEEEKLKKIGETIRKIRKDRKVKQKDLAKKMFCSQDRISRIENGTSRMSLYELLILCEVLETSPNQVLDFPPDGGVDKQIWEEYKIFSKIPSRMRAAVLGLVEAMRITIIASREN